MPEAFLTAKQVAATIGVDIRSVHRWCRDDKIPHLALNGIYRFRRTAIEAWLEANTSGVATGKKK